MDEKLIKKMIRDALQLDDLKISNIRKTSGGMTNHSYFVNVNDQKLVIRIQGSGTDELVNREEEKHNLMYATELGINPPLLYFNIDNGFKITEKIEGATPLTPSLAQEGNTMMKIISLFKYLHTAKDPMQNEFKLFDLMRHYESLIRPAHNIMTEKFYELTDEICTLQRIYESFQIDQSPSHIDPVLANLIKSKSGHLYLIDWEYSGMFDPLWDIATLCISLDLCEEAKYFFLKQYFEREPSQGELQRILMHMIFQDYLWGLWSLYKEYLGEDLGDEVVMRLTRARENIALYKENHDKDIIV